MGLRRRGTKVDGSDVVELDEDVYVVSPKAAEQAVKAQKETRRAARAERKLAEKAGQDDKRATGDAKKDKDPGPMTGAKVKRYIGIARIVVPVVIPVIYQAVGAARARWDDHRAHQLGVAPDELADFTGRGAALYARIHNLALSARDLRAKHAGGATGRTNGSADPKAAEVRTFVDDAEGRLSDLEAAVRAAEQMPAPRRRSAHVAVAAELDRIETRMLVLWGVGGERRPLPGTPQDQTGP